MLISLTVAVHSVNRDKKDFPKIISNRISEFLAMCLVAKKNEFGNRIYLQQAESIISDWPKLEQKGEKHVFRLKRDDITSCLLADDNIDTRTLRQVVKKLFAMIAAKWFFSSASKEIEIEVIS